MTRLVLAGAALGPLLVARVRSLAPAPGGIVVRPDAPKLDMAVVVDASPDDPVVKPLIATLTGQRPQPAAIVVEPGAVAPEGVDVVVHIDPDVQLASPEALDRIAAAVAEHGSVAVFPWQKTTKRAEMFGLFPLLLKALASGAFAVFPTGTQWQPRGLRAYARAAGADAAPTVFGGGHIVARVGQQTSNGRYSAGAGALAALYVALSVAAFLGLLVKPSRRTFGLYAAYVCSLSLCLRQVAKFPRASALIYPVALAGAATFSAEGDRVRGR